MVSGQRRAELNPGRLASAALDGLNRIMVGIAIVACLVMMTAVALNVATRYLLNWSIPGVVEATSALMVLLVLLPWGTVQIEKGHLQVEMIVDLFPSRVRALVIILAFAVMLGYVILTAWQGWIIGLDSLMRGEYFIGELPIPAAPSRLAIFAGAASFALVVVRDIWRLRNSVLSRTERRSESQ